MEKKNVLYALFIVGLMAVFAWIVLADFADVSISIEGSPVADTNYSGNLELNATLSVTSESNATNVTFFFYSVVDGSLTYNITFENSSANQSLFNYTLNTSLVGDGTYNLTVNATNASRVNIENSSITGVQIDNTVPIVIFNTPTNNQFYSSGLVRINATVTDTGVDMDTVIFNVTNASGAGGTQQYSTTKVGNDYWNGSINISASHLDNGTYIITAFANDTLNNVNQVINRNFTVDTAGDEPTVYLEIGQAHDNYTWTTDRTPTLYYNFTDGFSPNASCELFVDETGYGINSKVSNDTQASQTANASLDIGTRTWYVNCTDNGTNVGTPSTYFTLDVVRPINVSTPTNNSWTSETRNGSDGVDFTFNFISGFVNSTAENNVSCELWITNASGVFLANGVNTTALNNISVAKDRIGILMPAPIRCTLAIIGTAISASDLLPVFFSAHTTVTGIVAVLEIVESAVK